MNTNEPSAARWDGTTRNDFPTVLELDFSTPMISLLKTPLHGSDALRCIFNGVGNTIFLHCLFLFFWAWLVFRFWVCLLGTAFFFSLHCRSFRILFCCIYKVGSASAWLGYFSPLTLRYRMDRRWGLSFLHLYSLFLASLFSSHSLHLSESHSLYWSTAHRVVWTAARHAVR